MQEDAIPTKEYRAAREARDPGYAARLSRESRAYYLRHERAMKAKDGRRRAERSSWMEELKSRPCMDCGGRFHPAVMDWHHRDPAEKSFSIGHGIRRRKEVVLAEIAKCDLLCANCHRLRHYNRGR